jgi:hypothetical protein
MHACMYDSLYFTFHFSSLTSPALSPPSSVFYIHNSYTRTYIYYFSSCNCIALHCVVIAPATDDVTGSEWDVHNLPCVGADAGADELARFEGVAEMG